MLDEDGKLPPESETDKLQNVADAEDPVISAIEDITGREDFDDLTDDEIIDLLKSYGVSEDDIEEALSDIDIVKDESNSTIGPQKMANEDNTDVKVTEEDSDSDGDTDKVTAEKQDPEDDDAYLDDLVNKVYEKYGSDEADDKPHDTKLSDNVVSALTEHKY